MGGKDIQAHTRVDVNDCIGPKYDVFAIVKDKININRQSPIDQDLVRRRYRTAPSRRSGKSGDGGIGQGEIRAWDKIRRHAAVGAEVGEDMDGGGGSYCSMARGSRGCCGFARTVIRGIRVPSRIRH